VIGLGRTLAPVRGSTGASEGVGVD